ncbi:hypothetical protein Peur_033031 [Populus x canadensis]
MQMQWVQVQDQNAKKHALWMSIYVLSWLRIMNIKKPVVVHDTIEEETAWLNNSLVGQITEGINYQSIQGSLVDEGVQFYSFRFMGATQLCITELDDLHYPDFESIEYNMGSFWPLLFEDDDDDDSQNLADNFVPDEVRSPEIKDVYNVPWSSSVGVHVDNPELLASA